MHEHIRFRRPPPRGGLGGRACAMGPVSRASHGTDTSQPRHLSRPGVVAGRPGVVLPVLAGVDRHLLRHLPQPRGRGAQELFRADANSERYGLIAQAANPPPIRTACRSASRRPSVAKALMADEHPGEYIGLTCAACHNAQLNYQGKRIRIDGGVGNTLRSDGLHLRARRRAAGHVEGHGQVRPAGRAPRRNRRKAKAALRKRFEMDADACTSTAPASWSRRRSGARRAWTRSR